ncbi:DUF1850 domain-containing protein [Frigidibacter oleivorans]|uniref:DUF1850 domain-containing protein n=1 Tax=Frigidibacter oleivorans TaxID=2487129 RepID=UPI000F8E9570|nr:DUF1850 domain-containing protein [Frigidibacter oleivorans]
MSLCIAAGGLLLALAAERFTLDWTHSVEKIRWHEVWTVSEAGLRPVEAVMTGSGAGMEPPAGAVFRDGGWHATPDLPPQRLVRLAASGKTGAGWTLCAAGTCHELGAEPGPPVLLWSAEDCADPP